MKKYFITASLLATIFLNSSCQKDKLGEGNDEELITTVQLEFTPVAGGAPLIYRFIDLDGAGGTAPQIDTIVLNAATSYRVKLLLLNEAENPAENITDEVAEEADAHRFFYVPDASSGLVIDQLDTDPDGMPLGITSNWQTSAAGKGSITLTLRHYIGSPPDKQLLDDVNSLKAVTDISIRFDTRVD